MSLLPSFLRKRQPRRGVAAVELAFLAPFLIFLFVIGVDWARVFYYTVTINDCARNGAAYLSDPFMQAYSQFPNYQAAALAGTNLSPAPTVTSSSGSDSYGSYSEVTVAYTFTTVTQYPGIPSNMTVQKTVRMYTATQYPSNN
jgi:Flp pilus assembly protein TadG